MLCFSIGLFDRLLDGKAISPPAVLPLAKAENSLFRGRLHCRISPTFCSGNGIFTAGIVPPDRPLGAIGRSMWIRLSRALRRRRCRMTLCLAETSLLVKKGLNKLVNGNASSQPRAPLSGFALETGYSPPGLSRRTGCRARLDVRCGFGSLELSRCSAAALLRRRMTICLAETSLLVKKGLNKLVNGNASSQPRAPLSGFALENGGHRNNRPAPPVHAAEYD